MLGISQAVDSVIVTVLRRLGNRYWSRALLAKTCLILSNLDISNSRLSYYYSIIAKPSIVP